MRPSACVRCVSILLAGLALAQEPSPAAKATLEIEPAAATVGDLLRVTLAVELALTDRLDPPQLASQYGAFSVIEGGWQEPQAHAAGQRWIWRGALSAYRPGVLELPALRLKFTGEGGKSYEVETAAREITIRSVLPAEGAEEPTLADLKQPVSIAPDYRALVSAAGILALLLLVSLLLWWLHRRYAGRLAAVPVPGDPFHRTPPHVWVYEQLRQLLERRLAEQGHVELFFSELSRIVKLYLSGRYRVELMERTTAEVPGGLRQAGAGEAAIAAVAELLGRCDRVKFAKQQPGLEDCRAAVEQAYRIVDATRPADAPPQAYQRGAA